MKRYEEITVQEAARLLAEAGGPVKGMAFKDVECREWYEDILGGVHYFAHVSQFISKRGGACALCAKVIETKLLITEEERKAIRVLFPEHEWGAWDADGEFYVHEEKPEIDTNLWHDSFSTSEQIFTLDNRIYQSGISWEDSLIDLTQPIEK